MNLLRKERQINRFLQKSLLLAQRYGEETEMGKSILAVASKVAYRELVLLRFLKEYENTVKNLQESETN